MGEDGVLGGESGVWSWETVRLRGGVRGIAVNLSDFHIDKQGQEGKKAGGQKVKFYEEKT
jgi:hypothetical protein